MPQSDTEHRKTQAPSSDQRHDHDGKQAQDGRDWIDRVDQSTDIRKRQTQNSGTNKLREKARDVSL